jgi:hypothetical protein
MSSSPRKPRLFIGSSSEGLPVAKALQVGLDHSAEVTIWSQGVFGLSHGTLEDLVRASRRFDYAILVLTQDDLTQKRGSLGNSPRDNVIFELGLFMGALGRDRSFIVYSRDADLALPSDLAGVTAATYGARSDGNLRAALGAACTEIEDAIAAHGFSEMHEGSSVPLETRGFRRRSADSAAIRARRMGGESVSPDHDEAETLQRLRDSMLGDSSHGLSAEEVAKLSGYTLNTVRAYLCSDDRRKILGDAIRSDAVKRKRALLIVAKRRHTNATADTRDVDDPDDDNAQDGMQRLRDAMLGDAERGLSLDEVAKLSGYSANTVRVYLSDHRRKVLGDAIRENDDARARALAIVSRRRRSRT